ncbi:hypothetical protein ACS0TY_029508 [Phlomoides rotata]
MHFAPQNTHVSVDDAGPSAVPTGDSYHNSISDDEEDPLHEQAYKEYQFYYERANPTQAEASVWRIPEVPSSSPNHPTQPFPSLSTLDQLSLNNTFSSKDEMWEAVSKYHLINKVEFRVERADKSRWYLKCKHPACEFIFHASGKHDVWRVVKLTIPHTCNLDPDSKTPRSMKSKFLGKLFAKKLSGTTLTLTPGAIQNEVFKEYGLTINYDHARLTKGHAMSILYGDGATAFSKLPGYLYQLKLANPGSHTKLLLNDDHIFKYAFFALRASIDGFLRFGRPVIVIDGTHLKGKYCGIVFVAVTQDGNGQIFPLATGVGDVECNELWTWFLRCLREAYGCPNQLLFVSDQHASIIRSVSDVYPDAKHGLCYHHLQQKIAPFGKHVVNKFYDAAYTYRTSEFLSCMETLHRMDENGRLIAKLNTLDPKRWARVCCPVNRYEFMTSNAAESWNKKLLWARKLPVVAMLECARVILEGWFTDRRNEAATHTQILCKTVSKKMVDIRRRASNLVVTNLGSFQYKVLDVSNFFIVDLRLKKCDCGEFQLSLMPCIHAAATIRERVLWEGMEKCAEGQKGLYRMRFVPDRNRV